MVMTHVPSADGLRKASVVMSQQWGRGSSPAQLWFWLIGPPAWVSSLSSVTWEAGITSKILPQFTPLIWEMNFTSLPLTSSWTAFSSVQFSRSVVSNSLRPHGSQHARPPCPSPTPGVYLNSCPSSQWCQPAISSSVIPFSSCPQSLPASGFFQWVNSSHEVAQVLEFQL